MGAQWGKHASNLSDFSSQGIGEMTVPSWLLDEGYHQSLSMLISSVWWLAEREEEVRGGRDRDR